MQIRESFANPKLRPALGIPIRGKKNNTFLYPYQYKSINKYLPIVFEHLMNIF